MDGLMQLKSGHLQSTCGIILAISSRVLNKGSGPQKRPDKTVLTIADTVTVITIFYIKKQIVINSHHDDRN
jgi:hypothetical protein